MKKDLEQRCCKLAEQMGWTVSLQSDEPYPPSSYIFGKNYYTFLVTFTNPNNQSTKTQAKKRKQSEIEDYFDTVMYCVSDFDTFRRILIEKKDYKGPGLLLIDPVC